jgi:hypothetical protein
MVAPTVHFTVIKRPSPPRRPTADRLRVERYAADRIHADRFHVDSPQQEVGQQESPVADLLPWADPYIAMLAARLEAQGRAEQEASALPAPRLRLAR